MCVVVICTQTADETIWKLSIPLCIFYLNIKNFHKLSQGQLRFIYNITLVRGVFDWNEYKLWKKQEHIVKIFYTGILCITLTEINTKRFVQHWHSPKLPSTEWSWIFFHRICNFFIICYAVGLFQYSKNIWSKVRTPTVYIFISCTLMPQNCIRSGKSCKIYAMFTMFPSSDVHFLYFQTK